MKKAIEIEKVRILCDKCGWYVYASPFTWYNKICPSCKDYVPINKIDITFWKAFRRFMTIVNIICLPYMYLKKNHVVRKTHVSTRKARGFEEIENEN